MIGVADGIDTNQRGHELHYGMKALISEQYRRDLADMTHRGMSGRAKALKVTGGLPIGYRSEPSPDGQGKIAAIDVDRAGVVRRIFAAYAAGESLGAIAEALNLDGIPTSGKKRTTWQASAVRAVLKNEKYSGRWVWNTHKWLRDPATRKRVYRKRPESEWISEDRPELAIVDAQTWRKVEKRFEVNGKLYGKRGAPNQYLLTGILRCGECGSLMHVCGGSKARRYYQCAGAAKRGAAVCSNRKTLREDQLRATVLGQVSRSLLGPSAQKRIREIAVEEIRAMAASSGDDSERLGRRLKEVDAKIENLIDTLASGLDSPAVRRALAGLETERQKVAGDLAHAKASKSAVLPSPELIAQKAEEIGRVLDGNTPGAREALLRALLNEGRLDLHPSDNGYDVAGALALSALIPAPKNQTRLEVLGGFDSDGCGDRI